jgi:hypothetical protein
MTIKQFLKPDWRKKLVFIIIAVSFFILYSFIQQINKDACTSLPKKNAMSFYISYPGESSLERLCDVNLLPTISIINPIIGFWAYTGGAVIQIPDMSMSDFSSGIAVYLMFFFLSLPYVYLLSCLIVWIYDRVKKKK